MKLGLATECVADDEVVDRCREIATRMAGFPQGAPASIIESIRGLRNIKDPDAFFPKRSNSALLTAAQVKS